MAEIKISDLSVGDWVRVINQFDAQIDGYHSESGSLSLKTRQGNLVHYRLEDIQPIPLTPEILEKNGFDAPKAKVWNDSWYWSNRKDVALESRESFGLWYMEIVTKEQRSGLQSNRKLGIGFKYVHQLQHALRLAEVGKEIVV